jgi:hypothetical protein
VGQTGSFSTRLSPQEQERLPDLMEAVGAFSISELLREGLIELAASVGLDWPGLAKQEGA